MREPIRAPMTLQAAMARPSCHMTCPVEAKTMSAPRLVPALTSLAMAEACRKLAPMTVVKARMRKVPVPGPIIPS